MKPLSVSFAALPLTLALATPAGAMPDLIVLVRHAEKAGEPAADPGLSAVGARRAEALAQALAGLRVDAILTTPYRRTLETAAPLARSRGVQVQAIETRGGDLAGHVRAVADAVRAQSGVVLVVGHSNTVTAVLAALGGPALPPLCEASYQHAFVLQPAAEPPRWAQFSVGTPGPAPEPGCL